jgi:hypothetical protein
VVATPELLTRMSIVPISVSVCAIPRADAVGVGDVHRHDVGVAAFGLDLGAQGLQPLDATAGERDARSRLGEDAGELRAEPARRTGDEGDAARQIDLVAHGNRAAALRSVESTTSVDALLSRQERTARPA